MVVKRVLWLGDVGKGIVKMQIFAVGEIFAIISLGEIQTGFGQGNVHKRTRRTVGTIGMKKIGGTGLVGHLGEWSRNLVCFLLVKIK